MSSEAGKMVNDETHTQIFITLALSFNKYVWFIVCCFLFLLYAGAVDAYASASAAACAKGHRAAPLSAALTQTLLSVYLAVPATCTLDYYLYIFIPPQLGNVLHEELHHRLLEPYLRGSR